MNYTAYNGMRFTTEDMKEHIESTLQFMRKKDREEMIDGYNIYKNENGYHTTDKLSEKEITEYFELLIDCDYIELSDFMDSRVPLLINKLLPLLLYSLLDKLLHIRL